MKNHKFTLRLIVNTNTKSFVVKKIQSELILTRKHFSTTLSTVLSKISSRIFWTKSVEINRSLIKSHPFHKPTFLISCVQWQSPLPFLIQIYLFLIQCVSNYDGCRISVSRTFFFPLLLLCVYVCVIVRPCLMQTKHVYT